MVEVALVLNPMVLFSRDNAKKGLKGSGCAHFPVFSFKPFLRWTLSPGRIGLGGSGSLCWLIS